MRPPRLMPRIASASLAATQHVIQGVLGIVDDLARELRSGQPPAGQAQLDSNLERDLGFDSLERAELLLRVEKAFAVRLPARTLATAETPRDLARAVQAGSSSLPQAFAAVPTPVAEPGVAIPEHAATLLDVVSWHADAQPQRTHVTLLMETDEGAREEAITYRQLHDEAARVAAGLAAGGVESGQSVAIMLPTSRAFFAAFLGTLLAGGVPVPIYPPARRSQLEQHLRRQSGILGNCLATTLITVPEARMVARLLRASTPSLKRIVSVAELSATSVPTLALRSGAGPRDTTLLQYTSGSTGNPKGVILTHANLLANIRAMGRAAQVTPADVFVSWLPLYHDMGLIGAWLGSLYFALPLIIMPPTDFLARPERWLWAIHRYRATLSAGANFAYEMCATRLDESRLAGLDLASWRIAFNGSEPVSSATITHFAERFAAYGFDPRAQTPVYGLAESAVGLAFPPLRRGPLVDRIDRARLAEGAVAAPTAADDPRALSVVSCGEPLPGHELRVVDATGRESPERHEGRIQFRGPSATSGYFRNPEATRSLFDGDWLDTGDVGYIAAGELYVTGRAKDVIIRGGQHIHPQEAETLIGSIAGIRKGCVVVFGAADRAAGTEKVVVLAETRETEPARQEALRKVVVDQAAWLLGAPADDVILAPPHTVLKTSSGKLRRAACRDLYERGMAKTRPQGFLPQAMRLLWAGVHGWLRRALIRAGEILFASYAWTLLVTLGLVALVAIAALPRLGWRRHVASVLARAFVAASGVPVQVAGVANFPPAGPIIVVVNHGSYVDAIVLLSVLPERCNFVAKREFALNVLTRLLFGRLGTHFVERFDAEAGVAAAHELTALAKRGKSFAFFAEGTFTRQPGLRAFHMGAFVAAASVGTPLVPVAMRGTRSVLRDGQWFPSRALIQIIVSAPLLPDGHDWAAAVRLRDRARAAILAGCGEPDLAGVESLRAAKSLPPLAPM
jgi:1-acyl-sn-glycerol-3-phosphate acyltransferase